MQKTLLSGPLSAKATATLKAHGYDTICIPKSNILPQSICQHVDLQLIKVDSNLFVSDEIDLFLTNSGIISEKRTHVYINKTYPKDCALNIKIVGQCVFFNKNCIGIGLYQYLSQCGYQMIEVAQGYCGCSILAIDNHCIITADSSIAKAADKHQIEVLKIAATAICLPGYDVGFIGGASFSDEENVYFNGDINTHPNASQIKQCICQRGKNTVCLQNGQLNDVGGFVVI